MNQFEVKRPSGGNQIVSDNDSLPDTVPQSNTLAGAWLNWVRVLVLVAIAGAGYLAWVSFHNAPVAGCGAESGCSKVLQSRWAYWLER